MSSSTRKLKIGVFYGGKSAEHEVTVRSARNILGALDTRLYEPVLIAISKTGTWHLSSHQELHAAEVVPETSSGFLTLVPGHQGKLITTGTSEPITTIDIAFPVLHGPLGEDGAIQGLFELADLPYVGCGVLGSAVGMDKDVMKRLLLQAGLAITPHRVVAVEERASLDSEEVFSKLGRTLFIKPANMGSSVGVSRVTSKAELNAALDLAFAYDTKVVIEAAVEGVEVECAILGNTQPIASAIGRIAPNNDLFYSYKAKYVDDNGAELQIPAQLSESVASAVRETALKVYSTLGAEGLSRVDMFVTSDDTIIVNEVNTFPGFTAISMYPKLWEASGISYTELISRLLQLAEQRYRRKSLHTSH